LKESLSDIEELANLSPGFLEEKPAPVSLREFDTKRNGYTRKRPPEPDDVADADVAEFRTTGDGESR